MLYSNQQNILTIANSLILMLYIMSIKEVTIHSDKIHLLFILEVYADIYF